MKNGAVEPEKLVGQVRRFGEAGPVYEVLRVKDGGKIAEVRLPESEEKADVLVEFVLQDPLA